MSCSSFKTYTTEAYANFIESTKIRILNNKNKTNSDSKKMNGVALSGGDWITWRNPYQNPCTLRRIFYYGFWLAKCGAATQSEAKFESGC